MAAASGGSGFAWLAFASLTVLAWGLYGVFLHGGQAAMADPVHGRYKAFLFVGIAYFLAAVLAPLALLVATGASWSFPARGAGLSLVAGVLGATGAFGILLAFGARGTPSVVMSIVFAGAPVVNAVVALSLHRTLWREVRWPFVLGIALAALGGFLVTAYRPAGAPPAARPALDDAGDAAGAGRGSP